MSLKAAGKIVGSDSGVEQNLPGFKQFTRCKNLFDKETILSTLEQARKLERPTPLSPDIPGPGISNLLDDMLRSESRS